MPITVTQRPFLFTDTPIAKWNAAKNPIVYKFIRKDFNIYGFNYISFTNSGGALQITVNANLRTLTTAQGGPVVAGSVLYVSSDNGVYNGFYTVVTCTNAANSVITFAEGTYISGAASGYINLNQRTNYYLKVDVFNSANELLGSLKSSPFKNGSISCNIQTVILNSISPENNFDYSTTTVTAYDLGSYINFYIKYTEVWTNSTNAATDDVANKFFALYGARQIGSKYGGVMADYLCYEFASPLCKFLTIFARPVIWRNYPFSICILTSDEQTTPSNFRVQYFNSTIGNISDYAVPKVANAGKLIRLNISQNNVLAIPSFASTAQIRYERINWILSETLTCEIRDACNNPILLWWRNSLCGDAWWMFEINQEYTYRYDKNRKCKRYKLFADNLTLNQFDALNELITLGEVYEPAITELTPSVNKSQARIGSQVYMIDSTGKKTGVIVIPNEVVTLTSKSRHKMQITIELPEIY